jgi:ABC-type multidrug transport system fused ATPase/permease subunit
MITLEGLSLFFPILLQNVTKVAQAEYYGERSVTPLVWQGILVFAFITVIFAVQFWAEFAGSSYGARYQRNVRLALYEKLTKVGPEQVEQIGIARIMPMLMNDTAWLKKFNRQLVILTVYFPVAILGSFIMLFTLNWTYALLGILSLPFVIVFFIINTRRMGKKYIPASVVGYDELFFNIKDGIKGVKEIRILGKADERTSDFERHLIASRNRDYATARSTAMSTCFTMILFTMITIAIIVFGVMFELTPGEVQGVVALNTAIQYIDKLRKGFHQIFVYFVDFLPRAIYTNKRLNKVYELPDMAPDTGLKQMPKCEADRVEVKKLTYKTPNGKTEFENLNIDIPSGGIIAIAGGLDSGKSAFVDCLLKLKQPADGVIEFNKADINQINTSTWRREYISLCQNGPKFVAGTIRENMRLLNPNVTDKQIFAAFESIGAGDFMKRFDKGLDFEMAENLNISDGIKNVLSIVRGILKPAHLYIFNQCFEHVRFDYIAALVAKLRNEKKPALFITYNGTVCKHCDTIYVLKHGKVTATGAHGQLTKQSADYRELCASLNGNIMYEAEERLEQNLNQPVADAGAFAEKTDKAEAPL